MNKRYRGIVISLGIFIIMLLVVFVSNLGNSSSSKDINANLRLVNNISNQIRDLENNLFELKSNTYNESFDRGSLVNSWVKLQGDISDNINKKLENSSAVSSKNIKKIVLDWGIITGVFDNNKRTATRRPCRCVPLSPRWTAAILVCRRSGRKRLIWPSTRCRVRKSSNI